MMLFRVIPRGTKSKPSSSFLFLNTDFWNSLFAVTCASIIVSADADKCIKIMHSLERLSFAQLPGITPQYLWGGTTWAWFRITALLAHSLSVTLHHSFRKMFYPPPHPAFTSQVWLNYVLKDVLWQTASPGEVHFVHGWKWAAMWTAVKWLVFSSSLTTQSVLTLALTADKETWISWKQQKSLLLFEMISTFSYWKWTNCKNDWLTSLQYNSRPVLLCDAPAHLRSLRCEPPCCVSAVQLTEAQRGMDCDGQFSAPLWINLTGFNVSAPSTVHSVVHVLPWTAYTFHHFFKMTTYGPPLPSV